MLIVKYGFRQRIDFLFDKGGPSDCFNGGVRVGGDDLHLDLFIRRLIRGARCQWFCWRARSKRVDLIARHLRDGRQVWDGIEIRQSSIFCDLVRLLSAGSRHISGRCILAAHAPPGSFLRLLLAS